MNTKVWQPLRCLLRLWALLVVTTFAPLAIFAYDGQNQTTVAYDSSGESAVGYDADSVLTTGKKDDGTTGGCVSLAQFAEFLAAKGAGQGPVIIGETMKRVTDFAKDIPGAKILNDMPNFKAMGMNPDQVTSAMMQYNRKWILEQML